MSLSPQDYATAIGIAVVEKPVLCSCLVYLTKIVGEKPCGCDGWALTLDEGYVCTARGNCFPDPEMELPNVGLEKCEESSRKLFSEVERIRKEHHQKQFEENKQ